MAARIQYASVTYGGQIEADRSHNADSVSHIPGSGEYVVKFRFNVDESVIVVSRQFLAANNGPAFIDFQRLVGNQVVVRTFEGNGVKSDLAFHIYTYAHDPRS